MNALEVFKVLGVKPTDNYKDVKSVYINKLKKQQVKLAKVRGTDEETKISEDILLLNEAFNLLSESNILEMRVKAEAIQVDQENIPKSLRGSMEYEAVSRTEIPGESIKNIIDSIEVRWEDKELNNITEYITLNDFLNGSAIMFEDNSTLNIPAGFLGLMSRVVDNKIQFIRIKNKESVTFSFDSSGNLLLKSPPEDSKLDGENLIVPIKEHEFNFDLSKCKWQSNKNLWIGKNQGVKAYKSKTKGDLLIHLDSVKGNKNAEVANAVKDYFKNREGEPA